MDKGQISTMKLFGFALTEIPGKTIPKMTYYKVENNGVVELPNLPADPYHMQRYLKRGFVLERPAPPLSEPQIESPVGFSCETCGRVLQSRVALMGHSRSHKNKEVK